MKKYLLILSSLLIFSSAYAEKNYTFNSNLEKAYEKIMQLKLKEASQIIKSERSSNPDNLMNEFMADYIDYYTLLVNGSASKFKKLEKNKEIRLKKMEGGDFMSPYYLYTKAEVKIHWAILRTQYGDQLTAFRELRSAYKLLQSNQKKFPKFMANKKSLGMLRTIFSAIPAEYQWSTRAMGVNGDFNRGQKEIKEVLDYSKKYKFIFEKEARIIYAFLLLNVKNDENRAWKMINHSSINPKTSLLACFIQMRIAMKIGKNEQAIQLMEKKPTSSNYLKIPQMDYWLGVAKIRTLNSKANNHFKEYINSKHSNDYIKSSYLYLAYYEQLFGTAANKNKYIGLCKTKGSSKTYEDKKAAIFISSLYPKTLLKAQLLFNGGYYSRSSKMLKTISPTAYKQLKNQIRHHFLSARTADKEGKKEQASSFYKKAIEAGKGTKHYYVCQSALNLGELYEAQKNKTEARKYYSICLKLKSDRHESGYHKKAKAGLKRLK
jgi:hypothetical protein